MRVLIALAFIMASTFSSVSRGAPLQRPPQEDPHFQLVLQRSRGLAQKILSAIPNAHESCVHVQTLQLNVSGNSSLDYMASTIGVPNVPVLKSLSEDFTLEDCLKVIYGGLQQQQELLGAVSPRLKVKDALNHLMADIRDLSFQILKMQKMASSAVKPGAPSLTLRLPGEYEVQVASHLALQRLQAFVQDVDRCLRSLDLSNS